MRPALARVAVTNSIQPLVEQNSFYLNTCGQLFPSVDLIAALLLVDMHFFRKELTAVLQRRSYRLTIARIRRDSSRRGVAAVELAVCLPLLVMLILSSIHACTMIYLSQSLTVSAYEGVRTAIQVDGTNASATAAAQAILTSRNIQNPTVTISPSNVDQLSPGTPIVVTVSAPADANSNIPPGIYQGKTLSSTVAMVRE